MQPLDRKLKSKARSSAAAATELRATFDPLRGFPCGASGPARWMPVPRLASHALGARTLPSKTELRDAARSLAVLRERFPRALPKLVGDVDRWQQAAKATIEVLQSAHQGSPLPTLPPSVESKRNAGRLTRIESAVAWARAFDPLAEHDAMRRPAEWREIAVAAGEHLDRPAVLARIVQWSEFLAELKPAQTEAWLGVWRMRRAWQAPASPDFARHAGAVAVPTALRMADCLPLLAAAPREHGAIAIEMLAECVEPWVAHAEERDFPEFEAVVRELLGLAPRELTDIRRIVRRVPRRIGSTAPRWDMITQWVGSPSSASAPTRRAFADHLDAEARLGTDPELVLGFALVRNAWWRLSDRFEWLAVPPDRFFSALARLCERARRSGGPEFSWNDRRLLYLVGLCAVATPSEAADGVVALSALDADDAEDYGRTDATFLPLAWRLGGADAPRVAKILDRLCEGDARALLESSYNLVQDARMLANMPCCAAPWLGDLMLDGKHRAYLDLLRMVRIGVELGVDIEAATDSADARLRAGDRTLSPDLPEDLVAAIAALEPGLPGVMAAAEPAVAKAIGPLLAGAEPIARELRSIAAILASDSTRDRAALARRERNLRERLASGTVIPAARRRRLLQRIAARARAARVEAWIDAIRSAVRDRIPARLGAPVPEAWWDQPSACDVLDGILRLPKPFVRLAGMVLDAIAAGRWNGYLDHRGNRDWIARATAAGIDVDAWLRGTAPMSCELGNGSSVTLELERDPLQILQIGAWFQTCLSPGNINFYSTVVIAADANKHVVVARDATGRPLGRCILAIDDAWCLRSFYVYGHDRSLGLEILVERYAASFAAACGAQTKGGSEVECLTAAEWYDDGIPAVDNRFRKCLEAIDAEGLAPAEHAARALATLRREFGAPALSRCAADWSLNDSVSTELRSALIRLARDRDLVPRHYALLPYCNEHDPAMAARVVDACLRADDYSLELVDALLRMQQPSRALRMLARWHEVLGESSESLYRLGEVHLALHRRKSALAAFRRALKVSYTPEAVRAIEARLHALGAGTT